MGLKIGDDRVLHPGPLRWLRALGWMVLLFSVFVEIYAAAQHVANPRSTEGGDTLEVIKVAAICGAGLGLYSVLVRLAEGRWPEELSLRHAPAELARGLAIGTMMMSATVGTLYVLGIYTISGPRVATPWHMIALALESGIMEEILVRAVLLRLLMRVIGVWPALALQAIVFGALHLANPHATVTSAVALAVEAGVMVGGFYFLTGRLWLPIGVHAAWNFVQGFVWGAAISGLPVSESVWVSSPRPGVPEFLSGGAFGPEASMPALVGGVLLSIGVLWLARKIGKFQVYTNDAAY